MLMFTACYWKRMQDYMLVGQTDYNINIAHKILNINTGMLSLVTMQYLIVGFNFLYHAATC